MVGTGILCGWGTVAGSFWVGGTLGTPGTGEWIPKSPVRWPAGPLQLLSAEVTGQQALSHEGLCQDSLQLALARGKHAEVFAVPSNVGGVGHVGPTGLFHAILTWRSQVSVPTNSRGHFLIFLRVGAALTWPGEEESPGPHPWEGLKFMLSSSPGSLPSPSP